MNACMIAHATQQEEDAARRDWFAQGEERQRQREHNEEQKRKYDAFKRQWWGEYTDGKAGARSHGSSAGQGGGGEAKDR